MKTWKIVKCEKCGKHSATQRKANIVCVYCNKSTQFKKGVYSRVVKTVYNGSEAAKIVSALNGKGKK